MSFLRSASLLRAAARPATATARPVFFARPQVRFATEGYGSTDGSPAGEKPQQQGQSNSESIEHPGPAPPKVARGKSSSSPNEDSGSPANKDSKASSTKSSSSESSSNKSSSHKSSSTKPSQRSESNDGAAKTGGGDGKSVQGAKPKILDSKPPANDSEEVKQHNEEMDQRAEKAYEQVGDKAGSEGAKKDKVSKSFWAGQGGRDREP